MVQSEGFTGRRSGVLLPGGHLLVAKEKKPPAFIEFGPPHSRSRGLVRGGALVDGFVPSVGIFDLLITRASGLTGQIR
jgi:hypothetical protein